MDLYSNSKVKKKQKQKNDLLFLNTQVFNSLFKNPFKITTGFE